MNAIMLRQRLVFAYLVPRAARITTEGKGARKEENGHGLTAKPATAN